MKALNDALMMKQLMLQLMLMLKLRPKPLLKLEPILLLKMQTMTLLSLLLLELVQVPLLELLLLELLVKVSGRVYLVSFRFYSCLKPIKAEHDLFYCSESDKTHLSAMSLQ